MSKHVCLTPGPNPGDPSSPEFTIPDDNPARIIHGVSFIHGEKDGVALGHSNETNLYRAFHRGRCYELAINVTETSFANYEPGSVMEFKAEDRRRVVHDLEQILDSFHFLR